MTLTVKYKNASQMAVMKRIHQTKVKLLGLNEFLPFYAFTFIPNFVHCFTFINHFLPSSSLLEGRPPTANNHWGMDNTLKNIYGSLKLCFPWLEIDQQFFIFRDGKGSFSFRGCRAACRIGCHGHAPCFAAPQEQLSTSLNEVFGKLTAEHIHHEKGNSYPGLMYFI